MCTKTFNKLERIAHEDFASSLRTWCNSDNEDVQSSLDSSLAWINDISDKLLVGSKIDLLKISRLDRLSRVEVDFLKAAIPTLTYFSKSYSSDPGYESSSLVLKKWSGVPVVLSNVSRGSPNMFLNRVRFKNVLLRLLSHPSKDKRVRRMQQFLSNPLEMESSDSESDELNPHSSHQASPTKLARPTKTQKVVKTENENPQNVDPDPVPPENRTVLNPNTSMLLQLVDKNALPPLYIDYINPTPGLFSTDHLNLKSAKRAFSYHYHNCFLKNNQASWINSLRNF